MTPYAEPPDETDADHAQPEHQYETPTPASQMPMLPDPAADMCDAYNAVKQSHRRTEAILRTLSADLDPANLPLVGLIFGESTVAFHAAQFPPHLVTGLIVEMTRLAKADFHANCDNLAAKALEVKATIQ